MNTETDIVSLSEINAVAPYKVFYLFEKREVLHFSTNKGLNYAVTFVLDKTLDLPDMYQLVIEEINQLHAEYDEAVEKTLMAIISNFLANNLHILAFVCDTSDSREAARHALFNRWFLRNNKKMRFLKMDGVINTEGNMCKHSN